MHHCETPNAYQAYFGFDDFGLNIPDFQKNGYLFWDFFLSIVIEKEIKMVGTERPGCTDGVSECEERAQKSWVHATYLDSVWGDGSNFLWGQKYTKNY